MTTYTTFKAYYQIQFFFPHWNYTEMYYNTWGQCKSTFLTTYYVLSTVLLALHTWFLKTLSNANLSWAKMKGRYWPSKPQGPCMDSDTAGFRGSKMILVPHFNFYSIFVLVSFYRKSPFTRLGKWVFAVTDSKPPSSYT